MDMITLAAAKSYTKKTLDGMGSLQGKDGKSAYQIWLDNGNKGTEQDFLNSLKGAKGDTGATGATGPKGDKGDIGATGPKGDKGDKGEDGVFSDELADEITLNTEARHEHENKEVLDKISISSHGNLEVDGWPYWSNKNGNVIESITVDETTGDITIRERFVPNTAIPPFETKIKQHYKTSELVNDKNFVTAEYVTAAINDSLDEAVDSALTDAKESGEFNGADGISATHSWNGTTLTITSASGTSSANLKGETGANGSNGKDGSDGTDGVGIKSVVQTTTSSADGGSNVITVTKTDNTTSTFTVKNGSKGSKGDKGDTGAKGDKGDSYTLTEADKAEIVAMVIESLGGNPVFGYVDKNNNIIVSGNLADGSYNVKYEMEDGSMVDIGDLVLDTRTYYTVKNNLTNCTSNNNTTEAVEGGSYSATITAKSGYELKSVTVTMGGSPVSVSGGVINIASVTGDIVITAVATEVQTNDTDNILTNGAYTVELNKRWSASSKAYSTCNGMICITIPKADVLNKTIYFKGFTKDLQSSGSKALWMGLDANLARVCSLTGAVGDGNIWGATGLTDEGNGVYSIVINNTNFNQISSTTQFKLNMAVNASNAVTSLDGLTMTIDKPIS